MLIDALELAAGLALIVCAIARIHTIWTRKP